MGNLFSAKDTMATALMTMLSADKSAEGMLRLMIFIIGLFMVLWGINIFRLIQKGQWKGFRRIVDICGLLLMGIFIVMLIIPMIKGA